MTEDSVVKRSFAIVKERLESIATGNYRTSPAVHVGQSAIHRLANSDASKFPALILSVGAWDREADRPRRRNLVTLNVDGVIAAGTDYSALFDLLADVQEVIEDGSDPYFATYEGKNLLSETPLIVAPALSAPETGSTLEVLSCGIQLQIPTVYGDPAHVI